MSQQNVKQAGQPEPLDTRPANLNYPALTLTARDELEARATAAGLRVTSAVSRKTRLVVAADPDSESAKARRARELGIPLIAEPVFLALLDQGIPHPQQVGDQ